MDVRERVGDRTLGGFFEREWDGAVVLGSLAGKREEQVVQFVVADQQWNALPQQRFFVSNGAASGDIIPAGRPKQSLSSPGLPALRKYYGIGTRGLFRLSVHSPSKEGSRIGRYTR